MKILIIESQAIIALDIKLIIENEGYDVVGVFSSGEKALRHIEKKNIDLVVLNDDVNNQEICNYLRKNNIPVLYSLVNKKEIASLNMLDRKSQTVFLQKPFTEDQLIDSVGAFQMSA